MELGDVADDAVVGIADRPDQLNQDLVVGVGLGFDDGGDDEIGARRSVDQYGVGAGQVAGYI
jgi:hypothetical protein